MNLRDPELIFNDNLMDYVQPILQPIKSRKDEWIFVNDWLFEDTYGKHFIPRGFVTDLDSVPRLPFIYSILKGEARTSAALHDFYFRTGLKSFDEANDIFYHHMLLENVSEIKATLICTAVKWFGKKHYKPNEKQLNVLGYTVEDYHVNINSK